MIVAHYLVVNCEVCGKELKTVNKNADHHLCSACWREQQGSTKKTRMNLGVVLNAMQTGHANANYTPPEMKLDSRNVMIWHEK